VAEVPDPAVEAWYVLVEALAAELGEGAPGWLAAPGAAGHLARAAALENGELRVRLSRRTVGGSPTDRLLVEDHGGLLGRLWGALAGPGARLRLEEADDA
jgi:hypothetical protein